MILGTLLSIAYYSHKIEQEAVAKIGSDLRLAEMMLQESVAATEKLANLYARKKEVIALVSFGLWEKLGRTLKKDVTEDGIDLFCLIDTSSDCIVRSHKLLHKKRDILLPRIKAALDSLSSGGIGIMTWAEPEKEGLDADSEKRLVMSGVAPIWDRDMEKIVGAIVIRRFVRQDMTDKISKFPNIKAVLFCENNPPALSGRFGVPEHIREQVISESRRDD